jgi:hypothetical protein
MEGKTTGGDLNLYMQLFIFESLISRHNWGMKQEISSFESFLGNLLILLSFVDTRALLFMLPQFVHYSIVSS